MSDREEPHPPAVRRPGPLHSLWGSGQQDLPPWAPALLRRTVIVLITLFFAWNLIKALRGFLILLLISFFLAIALEPGVSYLARKGWRRGAATAVIFIAVGLTGAAFIGLMIPLVVQQTVDLVRELPSYADDVAEFLARFDIEFSEERVDEAVASMNRSLQGVARDAVGELLGVGGRLVNTFFQMLTIGLFTFYFTAEGPRMRRVLLSVLPAERQREALRVIEIAIEKTGGYFYSRALLAALSAVATWVVLRIVGVPFAVPLALWVGVISQFIPVFGTYLGGVLPVLIALLESPGQAAWILGYIVVYQQIENYIISPQITERTMSLHPALAFGSAIVGATLLGAPGALMALPVAATIQAFVSTYIERHQLVESHLLHTDPAGVPIAGPESPG
jgi:predicted PurR-regulated permease PerM